jgi:predicted dehydrogenase
LKSVIEKGRLGKLWRVHSRMEQDDPGTLEAGPTGGLAAGLGSHIIDQMLFLLGPAVGVSARLDMVDLPQGQTDAGFVVTILHQSGVHSHLSASKLNRLAVKEYRTCGEHGSYVASGTDIQAQDIFAGRRPSDNPVGWGYEPEAAWGIMRTG